jgi:predicted DsbA family dithiol-disulfide isomerase
MQDDVVQESKQWMAKHSVSGVPFFIINDTERISGAQESEFFADVFRKVIHKETSV